jgi:N-acetylmuramoyl-L-alanine amidase
MSVTKETPVVGVLPRISRESFAYALRDAGSPASSEANECWAAVAAEGVDPLFALAVFWHESRFGTVGVVASHDLRNPGATRSSRTGVGEPVLVPGRGQFWRYPNWVEGFRDLARRLTDPQFVYRQRKCWTIAQIIPIWAPAGDGNDPASYIDAVVRFMNGRAEPEVPGVAYRISWIPEGNANRPAYPMRPTWITIHETANESPGANAEMHRRFVHAGGGLGQVSFHYVVDDQEIIQLLPLVENGWHAGDGPNGVGNRASVGIEHCVHAGSNWERTQDHGARLVAALCRALSIPLEHVVPHQHWSGKFCPRRILTQGFVGYRERVRRYLEGGVAVTQDVQQIGPFGRHVGHGFLALWRQLERTDPTLPLRTLGWPLTDEFELDGAVYQVFERAVLKWVRTEPVPWDVHVAPWEDAVKARASARQRGLLPDRG